MENSSFWQNILLIVVGLLQQMVTLVVWEKHHPQGDSASQPDEQEPSGG